MKITAISDLHGYYPKLEGGDLLIVAGDLTASDSIEQISCFYSWLAEQKYCKKIVIAGNHDNLYQNKYPATFESIIGYTYLCDSGTDFEYEEPDYYSNDPRLAVVDGPLMLKITKLKIWGTPWTKTFPGMNPKCKAFTVDTDEKLAEKWALIPEDTNILVTHCPLLMYHDLVLNEWNNFIHVGSPSLADRCMQLKSLKLIVCGHAHEGYGITDKTDIRPIVVNASHVSERYKPINKPIEIEL